MKIQLVLLNTFITASILFNRQNLVTAYTDFCDLVTPSCPRQTKEYFFSDGCYRAAVLEHNRIDEVDIHKTVETNLRIINEAVDEAAKQKAQIIVLPEDAIFWHANKTIVMDVLEEIPDPKSLDMNNDNPCVHEEYYEKMPILRSLSCAARNNRIFIVANYGSKQECTPNVDYDEEICPERGFFMLNTNVVLDSYGQFIRRYRKYNTYTEIFDKAPTMERIYFDTDFGRIGIITCFDILFKQPAYDLVKIDKVDTIAFPTWWYDQLPFLSGIQFQEAWSRGMRVNLLAANMHKRKVGSIGSGIFARDSKTYVGAQSSSPKLIVKSLPIDYDSNVKCKKPDAIIDFNRGQMPEHYEHLQMKTTLTDTLESIKQLAGNIEVCTSSFCCKLEYSISQIQNNNPSFLKHLVVLVRDGLRAGNFLWYEQVCSLVTLRNPWNGQQTRQYEYLDHGLAVFDKLKLSVKSFSTPAIFPIASHRVDKLVENENSNFTCDDQNNCKFEIKKSMMPVNMAALYGRVYEKDRIVRVTRAIPKCVS